MSTPPHREVKTDRTMMVSAPAFHPSGRPWRPFAFSGLEKVTRAQLDAVHRLEWLVPGVALTGQVSEGVRSRLRELFDDDVRLALDYVHVANPKALKRYMSDPTFLGVIGLQPHRTRGFVELDLGLAHAAIDLLLGGAGEAVALRSLTDIEEGVMSYVVLEVLKAIAPAMDPGLPRLRLEGICRSVDDAVHLLTAVETQVAVVQLKAVLGQQAGYLRLFVPGSVLGMVSPGQDSEGRRQRRTAEFTAHASRLASVKTWLRAEIGRAEITSADLVDVRERDVVLVDELSARPDKGQPGTAKLRVGAGRKGWAEAQVVVEGGRYVAKIARFSLTEPPREAMEASMDPKAKVDESRREGAELLNDIPLQIAVELARVPVTAEDVVGLKVGQVIDLNRVPGEPVELSVNGKVVARGELVEVEGHLGVRVLSLAG